MAKINALKLDRPRCEAIRSYNYGNETGATDRRCKNLAKYEIGEKQLCEKHASMEALSILLRQQKVADKRRLEVEAMARRKSERA